ncbi:MAG: tetratricopeptide repeat protein [Rhodospirillaceae bacterium]
MLRSFKGMFPALLALFLLFGWSDGVRADDLASQANRQFIQAMQTIKKANAIYDSAEEGRLLAEADRLLADIITRFPDTDLAVQLVTNQFVGDFDFFEFRNRVKALVCTDQLSSKCFLFRIGNLLPPVETPIAAARWDWLSLAVAYHRFGDPGRAREIIAPFLSAVRRGIASESGDRDLFVGRALALTDQAGLALDLTRKISDCATRIYNLADIARISGWKGERDQAVALAEEARSHAEARNCITETGLVARSLFEAGREDEARTVFQAVLERQYPGGKENKPDCCTPELAVAAAQMAEPALALKLLRLVQDENPWTIPVVLGIVARRGEVAAASAYADQVQDVENRGECYAELIEVMLKREDRPGAEDMMKRLVKLSSEDGEHRPALIAQRARAEKALNGGDDWRATFARAITAAEHASSFVRRDIGGPLVAVLIKIETGFPLLD